MAGWLIVETSISLFDVGRTQKTTIHPSMRSSLLCGAGNDNSRIFDVGFPRGECYSRQWTAETEVGA